MRVSIGLAVGSESIRAVILRKGSVARTLEVEGTDCDIAGTIRELLGRAQVRATMRPELSVAVGPALC